MKTLGSIFGKLKKRQTECPIGGVRSRVDNDMRVGQKLLMLGFFFLTKLMEIYFSVDFFGFTRKEFWDFKKSLTINQ